MAELGRLRRFQLSGVTETGVEIGRGSYAVVVELRFRGLKCAGKKLHKQFCYESSRAERDSVLGRFEAECELLSGLRHPNVVQFLGVYASGAASEPLPVLVMEFLQSTLSGCLERHGQLPDEISYGVMADVATGLCYLHGSSPAIVHRDLSANNVLLTGDMRGKISDLGVSRILGLTPAQMTQMTTCPGTPSYMPPEALGHKPKYDTSIDCFSCGVMMLHVLSGQWPIPCEPNRVDPHNPDLLIALSEEQRRKAYLDKLEDNHPLKELIVKCLSNNPTRRPDADMILKHIQPLAEKLAAAIPNKFASLKEQQTMTKEKEKEHAIEELKHKSVESEEDVVLHEIAAESAQLRILELGIESSGLRAQLKAKEEEVEVKEREFSAQRKTLQQSINAKEQAFGSTLSQREAELAACRQEMRSLESIKEQEVSSLKEVVATLNANLDAKEVVIAGLKEQIGKYLTHQKEVPIRLDFEHCKKHAPIPLYASPAVLLEDQIFISHPFADSSGKHAILSYSITDDSWDTLPCLPLDLTSFGLGCCDGRVVTAGGVANLSVVSDVYVFHEDSQRWKKSIPSLPMKLCHSTLIGHGSALAVVGGLDPSMYAVASVYVYLGGQQEWRSVAPLPSTFSGLSPVVVGDTCYLTGGFSKVYVPSKMVLSVSLSRLFAPRQKTGYLWKTLPDTPYLRSSPALLGGALIVVGGYTKQGDPQPMVGSIHAYSPQLQKWIEIGNLPAPRQSPVCVTLPTGEVLVVGGKVSESSTADTMWKISLAF